MIAAKEVFWDWQTSCFSLMGSGLKRGRSGGVCLGFAFPAGRYHARFAPNPKSDTDSCS